MLVRKGMSRCPGFAPARACLRGGIGRDAGDHHHVKSPTKGPNLEAFFRVSVCLARRLACTGVIFGLQHACRML